jgi:hypothetical protein
MGFEQADPNREADQPVYFTVLLPRSSKTALKRGASDR